MEEELAACILDGRVHLLEMCLEGEDVDGKHITPKMMTKALVCLLLLQL